MTRIVGVAAALGGWLSIIISACLGVSTTEFLGFGHIPGEGPTPLTSVYGVPELMVLLILLGGAMLALVPVGAVLISQNPGRGLYYAAIAMAVASVPLLLDDLGRVHALALLPGAGLMALADAKIRQAREEAAAEASPASAQPEALPAIASATERESGAGRAAGVAADAAGRRRRVSRDCPWCSTRNKAGVTRCARCGAALVEDLEAEGDGIPGVTVVAPSLRQYAELAARKPPKKPRLMATLRGETDDRIMDSPPPDTEESAYQPPSQEVRQAMARLEREIEAGELAGKPVEPDLEPAAASARSRTPRRKRGGP
jgi:hypothetical protein